MALPYSTATTGKRALDDIQKIVRGFGCNKFGTGTDWDSGEVFVQFEHQGRRINFKASSKGYAAALLRERPYTHRMRCTEEEHKQKALDQGDIAVYSMLRDWIKGQFTAIECGLLSFDAAFLSHIQLASGRSVIEELKLTKMLEPPKE